MKHDVGSRVVLTLPALDQELNELERFRAYEYEMQLPSTTLVVCTTKTSAVRCWQIEAGGPMPRATNLTYQGAISEALVESEKQLEGLGFSARYPLRSQ